MLVLVLVMVMRLPLEGLLVLPQLLLAVVGWSIHWESIQHLVSPLLTELTVQHVCDGRTLRRLDLQHAQDPSSKVTIRKATLQVITHGIRDRFDSIRFDSIRFDSIRFSWILDCDVRYWLRHMS